MNRDNLILIFLCLVIAAACGASYYKRVKPPQPVNVTTNDFLRSF